MIVVDASAMVEALVNPATSPDLLHLLGSEPLAAPHLLDNEVLSALRRLNTAHQISDQRANTALTTYFAMTIARYETAALAPRIWELRHLCTAHDATYLALAEALDAPLVTADAKLTASGSTAELRLVAAGS